MPAKVVKSNAAYDAEHGPAKVVATGGTKPKPVRKPHWSVAASIGAVENQVWALIQKYGHAALLDDPVALRELDGWFSCLREACRFDQGLAMVRWGEVVARLESRMAEPDDAFLDRLLAYPVGRYPAVVHPDRPRRELRHIHADGSPRKPGHGRDDRTHGPAKMVPVVKYRAETSSDISAPWEAT